MIDNASDTFAKNTAHYLAEKFNISHLRDLVPNIYGTSREIFLVRDFRDVWVSARSLNNRRDSPSFGRAEVQDDEAWLHSFSGSVLQILLNYQAAQPGSFLVRYEDLIEAPRTVLPALLQFLQIEATDEIADRMVERVRSVDLTNASGHVTSASPALSRGRWRAEMTDREKELAR